MGRFLLILGLFVGACNDVKLQDRDNATRFPIALPIDTTYITDTILTDFEREGLNLIKTPDFVKDRFQTDFFKDLGTKNTSEEDLKIVYENLKDVDFITFQISLTEKLKLQFFHIDGFIADHQYYLYLVSDGKISTKGYVFWDVSIEGDSVLSVNPPKVKLVDLDADGKQEILLAERHHNGSSNSFIKNVYFTYDSELNLIPLESRVLSPK